MLGVMLTKHIELDGTLSTASGQLKLTSRWIWKEPQYMDWWWREKMKLLITQLKQARQKGQMAQLKYNEILVDKVRSEIDKDKPAEVQEEQAKPKCLKKMTSLALVL